MPLHQPTKDLLSFLRRNPVIRARIAAPPNKTMLYAGSYFRPIWQELEQLKFSDPRIASKKLLPEVLGSIATPGEAYPTLLAWAKALDNQLSWEKNGFVVWRALSGIFAANAVGSVSFAIGSGISKADKVFAATELPVLLRNDNLDETTRDMLSYYQRCISGGKHAVDVNVGFISA